MIKFFNPKLAKYLKVKPINITPKSKKSESKPKDVSEKSR